jgi:hypothetical protein
MALSNTDINDLDTLAFWRDHYHKLASDPKQDALLRDQARIKEFGYQKSIDHYFPSSWAATPQPKKSKGGKSPKASNTTKRTPMTKEEKKAKKAARRAAKRIAKADAQKILIPGENYSIEGDLYYLRDDGLFIGFGETEGTAFPQADTIYADWTLKSATGKSSADKKAAKAARRQELKAELKYWQDVEAQNQAKFDALVAKAKKQKKAAPKATPTQPFNVQLVIEAGYEVAQDNEEHLTDWSEALRLATEQQYMLPPASLKQYKLAKATFRKEFPHWKASF